MVATQVVGDEKENGKRMKEDYPGTMLGPVGPY
jgi:hypothetical protein